MSEKQLLESQAEIIKLISSGEDLNKVLKLILTSLENHSSTPQICGFIMTYDLTNNKFSDIVHNSIPHNIVDLITSQVIRPSSKSSSNTNFFKKVMSFSNVNRSYLWKDYTHIIEEHGIQSACSIPILSSENYLLGTLIFLSKESLNINEDILKNLQPYSQLASIAIAMEMQQKKMTNNENNKILSYERDQQFNRKEAEYKSMLSELTHALERMEFEIYYQPYFGVDEQSMGLEALIRWNHPQNGLMAPAEFLGVAEESGFILELEKWVLFQSLYEIKNLHQKEFNHLTLSVNISAKQLESDYFPALIADLLKRLNFEPKLLTLEVTERFLMHRDNIKTLNLLKELGINISIDDFGTAYSSLQYFKDFPVDEVKIDRGFITNLETNVTNQKIVAMIIILGHQLNMRVVAEGVETKQQYHILKEMGCDIVQGFLFSRPLPLNTIKQNFFSEDHLIVSL